MASRSAAVAAERPFYDRYAWAYDLLVDDPVGPWVDAVDEAFAAAGIESAEVLDAGCGTGRHAAALFGRGLRVTLLDASPALLRIAQERCPDAPAVLGDVCAPAGGATFDGVVSRGVLNDLLTDRERDEAVTSFAGLTRPGGVLVLDVREVTASRERADGHWRTRQVDLSDGSRLQFDSRPTWVDGLIRVEERYKFTPGPQADTGRDGGRTQREYAFAMRPWTTVELGDRLGRAGYRDLMIHAGVGRRTPDRLLVVARR